MIAAILIIGALLLIGAILLIVALAKAGDDRYDDRPSPRNARQEEDNTR